MKRLLILILTLCCLKSFATDYYFAASGNNSNPGTQAQPFQTLARFSTLTFTGNRFFFNRGDVFTGSITVTQNGTAGTPVVFDAYGTGAKPIITGFVTISNWTSVGGGIYESTSAVSTLSTLSMVTLNGVPVAMGRYPKLAASNSGYLTSSSGTSNSLTSSGISSAPSFVGGQVVIRLQRWLMDRCTITAQSSTVVTYTAQSAYTPQANFGFFFQDHPLTLTQPGTTLGEWYYDPSTKKIRMYFGANSPASYTVKVSTVQNLVTIASKNYITFQNIAIEGGNTDGFVITSGTGDIVQNCDITYIGRHGLNAASTSALNVSSNYVEWCNSTGLQCETQSSGATIYGNTVKHIRMFAGMAYAKSSDDVDNGIICQTANSIIRRNIVIATGFMGIRAQVSNNTIVDSNYVDSVCFIKDDGGGIYTWASGSTTHSGMKILNNVVLNSIGAPNGTSSTTPEGEGIYIDDNSDNIEVANNTVAYCRRGIFLHNNVNIYVHDNTSFNNQYAWRTTTDVSGKNTGLTIKKNIFFAFASTQFPASFRDYLSATYNFGTVDSNYYCRPILEPDGINSTSSTAGGVMESNPTSGARYYSLNIWKTVFPAYDQHSKKTFTTVSTTNNIRFEYNATASSANVNLGASTYIEATTGVTKSGTISIPAYSSIILLVSTPAVNVKHYYFSTADGDDSRTPAQAHNPATPWKTVSKLNSYFSSLLTGDSVFFKRGEVFPGSITVNRSGSVSAPIVITAYGTGAKPIITGMTTLTSFTQTSTNIWTTPAIAALPGATIGNLIRDGRPIGMGRYPNENAANAGYLTIASHVGTTSITGPAIPFSPIGYELAIRSARYSLDRCPITAYSGGTITYAGAVRQPTNGFGYFIQNGLATLDQQNEWFHDRTAKTIAIYSVGNPATGHTIEVPTVTNLVTSNNFSYITIDGLVFRGSNSDAISVNSGTGFSLKNCDIYYAGRDGVAAVGSNPVNFRVTNNTINYSMNQGIHYYADNGYVADNVIHWVGMLRGLGQNDATGYKAVQLNGDGNTFEYNRLDSIGSSAIVVANNSQTCQYNFINYHNIWLDDGGGIYMQDLNRTTNWRIIKQNIILNGIGAALGTNSPNPSVVGIYFDDGTDHSTAIGNTVAYQGLRGIYLHGSNNNRISNNLVYATNGPQMYYQQNNTTPVTTNQFDTVTRNAFVTASVGYIQDFFHNGFTNVGTIGRIDSNNYVAATNVANVFHTVTGASVNNYYNNIPAWRVPYPQYDANSTLIANKWNASVNIRDSVLFLYNDTKSVQVRSLGGISYLGVDGVTIYTGSITLQPFTSWLGLRNGTAAGPQTPVITWSNPAAIIFGTALGALQLNATVNAPGVLGFSPVSGTIFGSVGTYILTVNFTPTDPSQWTTATKQVTIVVNPRPLTGVFSNTTKVFNNTPQQPTFTTSPVAGVSYAITYDGVGAIPVNVKIVGGVVTAYNTVAGITDPNYSMTPVSGTFTITPAPGTLTVSNLTFQYDSTLKNISVSTSNPAITYTITGAPQRYKGSYPVNVHNTNTNYSVPDVNTTLTITPGVTTVTWNPANLTYPTPTGAAQTNATSQKTGAYIYNPPSGTVLSAGTQPLSLDFVPSDTNIAPIIGIVRNITVNKGVTSISVSDTIQYYDGLVKNITAIAGQSGTVSVAYTGAHILVGDYPFTASFSSPNWTAPNVSGTLHILPTPASIVITNFSNRVYTGSPILPTVTSPYTYSITFNGSTTVPTNTGSYTTIATINDGQHIGADTVIMTIIKATPPITWPAISNGVYPYTVSSGILNASSTVSGSFSYNVSIGDIIPVGTTNIIATFTSSNPNYNNRTVTNSVTVTKGTDVIIVSDTSQSFDGNPKPISATSSHGGTLTILYGGSPTPPSAIGNYPFTVSYSDANWQATTVSGTLHITSNPANIFITDYANLVYTGSPISPTVTSDYSYTLTFNGSSTLPTNVGTYTTIATINDGIHTGADTVIMTIIKANPPTTWGSISAITYPSALSGTQLNLTSPVAGSSIYTPSSGSILAAGTHIISDTYTPTDLANYNIVTVTNTITVNQGTANIAVSDTIQFYDGTPKPITAVANQSGTVTILYSGSPTAPTSVGDHPFTVTFSSPNWVASPISGTLHILASASSISITNFSNLAYTGNPISPTITSPYSYSITFNGSTTVPTNVGSYTTIATINDGLHTGADTVIMTIIKATPSTSWPAISGGQYPYVVGVGILNASSPVAGTWVYSVSVGDTISVGTVNISGTFTPTNGSNYNSVTIVNSITVTKGVAVINASNFNKVYDGSVKFITVSTTPPNLDSLIITYTGNHKDVGSYPVSIQLNNLNYMATSVSGTLIISQASYQLAWVRPAPIQFGTPLSALELNPTSTIPGMFTFNYNIGYILPAGTIALLATFHPTDSASYPTQTVLTTISVYGTPFLNYLITNHYFDNLPNQ